MTLMTLSEAIIHCEEVADRCAVTDGDLKCEMQHRQLAEWLRELQQRRAQSEWNPCNIGWIPCNDKMPEIGRDVLISKKPFNILGFEQRVVIGKRQYDPRSGKPEWWSGYGVLEDKVVIAWMPLPEPYKEGEQE